MRIFIKNRSKRIKYFACLAIIVFSALAPLEALAVDKGFYSANDILFYDPTACGADNTPSGPSNGSVVAIGDSLLARANSNGDLAKKLKSDNKYTAVTVDAQVSRFIYQGGQGTSGNPSSSGLDAIDNNKEKITSAGTIIIVLGTNYDSDFDKGVKDFMTKIRALNNNADVFWVNIANTNDPSSATNANKAITKYSTYPKYNYSIVDWHGAVYGGGSADNTLLDGSGYHQSTPNGVNKYVSLILDKVGKYSEDASGGTGGSAPIKGTQQEKNAARVWNFLIGKGLTAEQAAGFLGNMQAESGIRPDINEYSGGGGYGLIQWTGSRRTNLENFAASKGKPASDLDVQLEFLWHELTTSYQSSVLNPLKKTKTVRAAAVIILFDFENPANQDTGVQDDRTRFAEKWFKFFKGFGSGGDSTVAGGCPDTSGGTGACIGGKDVVATALCLAWDNGGHGPNESDAKPEYVDAKTKYNPGGLYSDCGVYVATTVIASGVDTKYVKVGTTAQRAYVKSHPEKYDIIPNKGTTKDLEPGDIFVASGHSYLFVGDGVKGGNSRSASLNDHVPEASNAYFIYNSTEPYLIARVK